MDLDTTISTDVSVHDVPTEDFPAPNKPVFVQVPDYWCRIYVDKSRSFLLRSRAGRRPDGSGEQADDSPPATAASRR